MSAEDGYTGLLVDFGGDGSNVGFGKLARGAADQLLLVTEPEIHRSIVP